MNSTIALRMFNLKKYLFLFLIGSSSNSFSQNIGINTSGAAANSSALLDIGTGTAAAGGDTKGLLVPRVALTSASDALTILSPATSLLVYCSGSGGLTPAGYYYNSGTPGTPSWVQLITPSVSSTGCADGCAWTLKAVANATLGVPGYSSTVPAYPILSGKEYLAVLNDACACSVNATMGDNPAVFEITPSYYNVPAGKEQVHIAIIDPIVGGKSTFNTSVSLTVAKIKGRTTNGSGTQVQISFSNTTGDYIAIDGAGNVYLYNNGGGDAYLYLFER